jgi:hypothetical protein
MKHDLLFLWHLAQPTQPALVGRQGAERMQHGIAKVRSL